VQLGTEPIGQARPARSRWADADILPALTRRAADLEAELAATQIDLEAEQRRLATYAESDPALNEAVADGYRNADTIVRRALHEADAVLRRAIDERRMLVNEVGRLREERAELEDEIASLRRGELVAVQQPTDAEAPASFDLQTAVMEEMRALLLEIVRGVRAPAAPLPPVVVQAVVNAEVADAVRDVPVVEQIVDVVETVTPPTAVRMSDLTPIEPTESVVEHVDELVRRPPNEPIVDEFIEELRAPEPTAPIVDEYVEAPRWIETEAATEELEAIAAPPEPAPQIVAEPIPEPLERAPIVREDIEEFLAADPPAPVEAIEVSPGPADATVEEYVDELPRAEAAPWSETIQPSAAPAEEFEAIVAEYVEAKEVSPSGVIEPTAPEASAPLEAAIDFAITPPPALPPVPDARIDALWDAATPTAGPAETTSLPAPEPTSFVEPTAETGSLEIPEAPLVPPFALPPEPPIQFASEPPVEVMPESPFEFGPEPTPTSASPFPELKVADEAGLHQIQIVISPIHSFPRLLETEARIRALSTVRSLHLRDFRNGVATFAVAVGEAISPAEFGAVIQMLQDLHLRLEGTTQASVELRAEDEPPAP